jgi:U3 small nucleolar ribonucleoprotein component
VTHLDSGSADDASALFVSLYGPASTHRAGELRRSSGVALSATTLLHEAYFKMKERSDSAVSG